MKAWFAIAGGYVAALVLAWAFVNVRYLWIPADVANASSGMYAFGDLMGLLVFGGVFSLVPTWFALRRVRDSERFWGVVALLSVGWAACAPLAAGVLWVASSTLSGGGTTSGIATLVHVLSILRLVIAPGSAGAMVVAWWMCARWPSMRRLFIVALAAEVLGLLGAGAWFVAMMVLR